jgi:hypothetical protein
MASTFRRSAFVGDMDVMTFKTSSIASRLESLHIFLILLFYLELNLVYIIAYGTSDMCV